MRFILSSILSFFILCSAFSQVSDNVLLYNGNKLSGKVTELDSSMLSLDYLNKKEVAKVKTFEKASLFSYTQNGIETIMYNPDTASEEMSVEEYRMFIEGMQRGDKNFHSEYFIAGGIVLGFGTTVATNSKIAGISSIPLYSILSTFLPRPKRNLSPENRANDNYVLGYRKKVRQKRGFNTALGGVIGFVGGLIFLEAAY